VRRAKNKKKSPILATRALLTLGRVPKNSRQKRLQAAG
jgi:hypothetical protein